jgi:hypothetical protein
MLAMNSHSSVIMKNTACIFARPSGAILFSALALAWLFPAALHAQGTFPPPSGPTVPVMKTLTQVEPRTPIPAGGSYTISAPGSYYLTGNIANSGGTNAAITISASEVTLDLNGFTVTGQANAGVSDYGIWETGQKNIVIRNGAVKQAAYGIYLGNSAQSAGLRVEAVNCHQVYVCGIYAASIVRGLYISHCTIDTVGSASGGTGFCYGIYTFGGAHIESCMINGVKGTGTGTGYGINSDTGSFTIGNTIGNCDVGIKYSKYRNNLTEGCTTPFQFGTDAGGNN